jgi:hypothetical protein
MLRRLLITVLLVSIASTTVCANVESDSQGRGSIQGQVSDAASGKALVGATVLLVGRFGGTMADTSGHYRIKDLPPGNYTVKVSHVGYETNQLEPVQLEAGDNLLVDAALKEKLVTLKGITVTPGRFQIMGTEATAHQSLTRSEMETVPQLGDDFFRAVTRLPGMSGSDFSTRFTVRGGEYDEVLVTLDGLQIYEPFHMRDIDGGAISVIDVAAVEGIDLMTGGFAANYGSKMSGVFNINSKPVQPDSRRMSVGLSMMNLRFLTEGTYGNNRGSWLVSARRGYIDLVLKLAGADDELKPTYYDVYGKTQYQLSDRHILGVSLLHSGDDLELHGKEEDVGDTVDTRYSNSYFWLTLWSQLRENLYVRSIASLGQVKHERWGQSYSSWWGAPWARARDDEDFRLAGFKSDWEWEVSPNYFMQWGWDVRSVKTEYSYVNREYFYETRSTDTGVVRELDHIDTVSADLNPSGTQIGAYLSNRIRLLPSVTTEIGLRYDRASYSGDELLSPRVNFVLDLSEHTKFRAGWGLFYQSENIDEIAVGWGETEFYPAEKAEHWVAGLQHDFEDGTHLRIEGYYKRYSDLRPEYRNSFDDITPFPEVEEDRNIVYRDRSESRGLEVYLKRDTRDKVSWWASYAYSKFEDQVSDIAFPPEGVTVAYDKALPTPNDQRHTLNFDLNYRPNHSWQLNLAFKFHTGWPYTGVHLVTWTDAVGDRYSYVQSDEQWSSRHANYRRMDVRVNRYFGVGSGRITAFVELLNVLGTKNVRGYSYDVDWNNGYSSLVAEPEHWFGRIPSFGVAYEVNF